MEDVIVRNNGFSQGELTIRALYPEIFSPFLEFFAQDEIPVAQLRKEFRRLKHAIRTDLSARHRALENPASASSGGRRTAKEETLRNKFRCNVYTLMRELDGLDWWQFVEPLVQRKTPGKRPRSPFAKKFSDLLHYILRNTKTGKLIVFDSAAIGDVANQLAYAQRHDVPFQFLIGFLYEIGFDQAAEGERSGGWEDWYPHDLRSEQ